MGLFVCYITSQEDRCFSLSLVYIELAGEGKAQFMNYLYENCYAQKNSRFISYP